MGIELSGECLSEYRIIGAYRGAIGDHYRIIEPGLSVRAVGLQWGSTWQHAVGGRLLPSLFLFVLLKCMSLLPCCLWTVFGGRSAFARELPCGPYPCAR